jgi:hypothetical protein
MKSSSAAAKARALAAKALTLPLSADSPTDVDSFFKTPEKTKDVDNLFASPAMLRNAESTSISKPVDEKDAKKKSAKSCPASNKHAKMKSKKKDNDDDSCSEDTTSDAEDDDDARMTCQQLRGGEKAQDDAFASPAEDAGALQPVADDVGRAKTLRKTHLQGEESLKDQSQQNQRLEQKQDKKKSERHGDGVDVGAEVAPKQDKKKSKKHGDGDDVFAEAAPKQHKKKSSKQGEEDNACTKATSAQQPKPSNVENDDNADAVASKKAAKRKSKTPDENVEAEEVGEGGELAPGKKYKKNADARETTKNKRKD